MAERISVIDDSVLELVGELYVHEDEDFKARVTFADYLKIALRAYPKARFARTTSRRGTRRISASAAARG